LWVPLIPVLIIIPPTAPHSSSSIIRGSYSRPNSGRRTKCTLSLPPQETNSLLDVTTLLYVAMKISCGASHHSMSVRLLLTESPYVVTNWFRTDRKTSAFACRISEGYHISTSHLMKGELLPLDPDYLN
jgi:hypothetical protein